MQYEYTGLILTSIGAIGAILGGIGACSAAALAYCATKEARNSQAQRDLESKKTEQERAKFGTLALHEDATNLLNQYVPEFTARVRSLRRRHRRSGSVRTITDIDLLAKGLLAKLNEHGHTLNAEKRRLADTPNSIVKDWRIEEIKGRDILGSAKTKISECRFSLNEYEDDLEDKLSLKPE